jgi:hypothetical protein
LGGTIVESPYPILLVDRPGKPLGAASSVSAYPLTVPGKHGADQAVAGLDGLVVDVRGELVYREGQTMVQLRGEPQRTYSTEAWRPELEYVGAIEASGEIVDSKCYLGVMKPGREKPHRACASLCIRGGVPPMLVVEESTGDRHHYLLMSAEGGPLGRELLDLVAEPVRVRGREYRLGELRFIAASPLDFERIR